MLSIGCKCRPQRWHSTLARSVICLAVATCALALASCARAQCPNVDPVACPECFAVFVIPDTQHYTLLVTQPQGAAHLDLVTRYICANATAWKEPSTGKVMPILMTIQLGDLVQSGDLTEGVAGPLAEWERIDAAMDRTTSTTATRSCPTS